MSESVTETDDVDTTEEPTHTPQATDDEGSDFLTDAEKEVLQDWLIYVTGLFATAGLAIGLHFNIQDQWDHQLLSASGGGPGVGGFAALGALPLTIIMIFAVGASVLLGVYVAKNVDNSDNTAYKVAGATAIVGLPVLLLLSGFLYAQTIDNFDLEFVNVIVSGLGAGIAAAIGAAIAIYLQEEQAPSAQ